jgi:hypothetical protein
VEAPPFAERERERERAIRSRGHPQAREEGEERDHSQGGSLYSKEATTSGGGSLYSKEDTVRSVTMINSAMPSTLMGNLLICPWVVNDLEM